MLDTLPSVSFPEDSDGERTCGTCGKRKSVNEFYRDGKDNNGQPRFRRDCKDCYRKQRLNNRKAKRFVPIEVPQRRKRKK